MSQCLRPFQGESDDLLFAERRNACPSFTCVMGLQKAAQCSLTSSPATCGSNAHCLFAGPANTLSSSCCVHVGVVTTLMWSTWACTVGVGATAALAEHPGWISFESSISHMLSSSHSVLSSRLQCKLQIKAPNLCLSLHMLYMLHMGSALAQKNLRFCTCRPVPNHCSAF